MDFSSASRDLDAAAQAAGIAPARYQGPQISRHGPAQPTPSQSSKAQIGPRPAPAPTTKKTSAADAPAKQKTAAPAQPAVSKPSPSSASSHPPAAPSSTSTSQIPASARASKLSELQSMIDTRLRPDLERATAAIEALTNEIGEWETLIRTADTLLAPAIKAAESKGQSKPARVETQVDLGNGFFCSAVVPDARYLMVDVGLGFYAEMLPHEASSFARDRVEERQRQRKRAVEAAAGLSARIKVLLTGIDDLRAMG